MNKNDIYLIIIIILIGIISLIILNSNDSKNNYAIVLYDNKEILKIDLTKNINTTYEVEGFLGKVKIEQDNNKIRVIEENSPLHLCKNQGYIEKTHEVIVCLPNHITIKIEGSSELDSIAR